jgi:hypothetical protein
MSGPKVGEDVLLQSREDFTRARSWMGLGLLHCNYSFLTQ